MSLRVYHADLNPDIDHFSYRQSDARAQALVETGQGRYILLADGRKAVQLFRSRADRDTSWVERLQAFFAPADNGKLPPREVPGVYFEEPQSAMWKEQHRKVDFSSLNLAENVVISTL